MSIINRIRWHHVAALAALLGAAALLIPVPAWTLDLFVSLNLGLSVALFGIALVARNPLELHSLPPLLVVSSIARVIIALAIGRAVLTHQIGGAVVKALGEAASATGWVTGLALLVMIALVDLLVIAVGMVRVSEVLARFALDALPGRQMAVDTAVSGGRLSAEEAAGEMAAIDRNASFFGAMDGAARFLRGDCIASLAIVAVTAAVAVISAGMPLDRALSVAAGHGLAILFPAVLVGSAGAIVLSRAGAVGEFGSEIAEAWVTQPLVSGVVAVTLLALAVVSPGARIPLVVTAAVLVGLVLAARRFAEPAPEGREEVDDVDSENRLEIGLGLAGQIDLNDVEEQITAVRTEFEKWAGFSVTPFVISDDPALGLNELAVVVNGLTIAEITIRPGRLLAVGADWDEIEGATPARLGARRLGAWVPPGQSAQARELGARLMDAASALSWCCQELLRANAAELFDTQRAAELMAGVEESRPAVVEAADDAGVDAVTISRIGGRLLEGRVPLHNGVALIEAVTHGMRQDAPEDDIAESARRRLARSVCETAGPDGVIMGVEISPELSADLVGTITDGYLSPGGQQAERWMEILGRWERESARLDHPISLLCDRRLRGPIQRLVSDLGFALMVLCSDELQPEYSVRILQTVEPADLQHTSAAVEG